MDVRRFAAVVFAVCAAHGLFAQESPDATGHESLWDFSVTADFAYYPESKPVAGGTHFAPVTGAYSGLEGRVTGNAAYTIPTPLGEHWLLSGAALKLTGSLELTPVSVKPGIEAAWSPLPFLVFSAGGQIGTGWNLAGLQGMATFNGGTQAYDDLTPFTAAFLKWYAQGTFQFDTGAIWQGDWTHIQLMYSYQVYYERLSGVQNQRLWCWQCTENKVNGLANYQSLILAYQMPLVLSRVGVLCELNGYYADSVYKNDAYNGSFKTISVSPMAQLAFGQHDTLTVLAGFSSRRSYEQEYEDSAHETSYTKSGREWFFNRLALSWTHVF